MAMSKPEKEMIHHIKQHAATEDETVAICLLLRNDKEGQQEMIDFLVDYPDVSSPDCVDRALEIHDFHLMRKVSTMISEHAGNLPASDLEEKLRKYAEDQIINVMKAHERIYSLRKLGSRLVKAMMAKGMSFEDADEVYGVFEIQRHLGEMLAEVEKHETLTKEQALRMATAMKISPANKRAPEALFANRQKLLRITLDMGISAEKLHEMVEPMHGCSDREKEEIAKKLLEELQNKREEK